MAYNPLLPITTSNCPTRAALERNPQTPGFLAESIGARHTRAKAERHAANVQARAAGDMDYRRKAKGTGK